MAYNTVSGDTFDSISYAQYGDEKLAVYIIEANLKHADVIVFGSGIVLIIPDIDVTPSSNLPPWKRGNKS